MSNPLDGKYMLASSAHEKYLLESPNVEDV